jgi:hypothetical protein
MHYMKKCSSYGSPQFLNITIIKSMLFAVECQHSGVTGLKGERMKGSHGFLLLELAVALVFMSIVVVVTLHLVNDIATLYREVVVSTSLLRVTQVVCEGGSEQRDADVAESYDIAVHPLATSSAGAQVQDVFSWIVQHVVAHKIVVRPHNDVRHTLFDVTVVDDNDKTGVSIYAS